MISRSNSDNLKEKLIKDIYTLFAFGEGTVDTVKQMVLDEISNLKNAITPSSNVTSMTISDSLPKPVSPSLVSPFSSASNAVNTSHSNLGLISQSRSNPVKRSDTILFAGDSLLNRMSIKG